MVRIGCLIGRRMANERLIASIGLQCYLGQPFAGRILMLTTTVAAVHSSSSSSGLSLPASSFRLAKVHVVVGVFQLLLQKGKQRKRRIRGIVCVVVPVCVLAMQQKHLGI